MDENIKMLKLYMALENEDVQEEPTMEEILQQIQGEKMKIKVFDNEEMKDLGIKTCTKEEYENLEAAVYKNENIGIMVKKYKIEVLEEDSEPWATDEVASILTKHCDIYNSISRMVCDEYTSDKVAVEIYKKVIVEVNETLNKKEEA